MVEAPYTRREVIEVLRDWETSMRTEPTSGIITELPLNSAFDRGQPEESILVFVYSVYGEGHAIIAGFAHRYPSSGKYSPRLVVTERVRRKHPPGVGLRIYFHPRRDDYPNFARAIEMARIRHISITTKGEGI